MPECPNSPARASPWHCRGCNRVADYANDLLRGWVKHLQPFLAVIQIKPLGGGLESDVVPGGRLALDGRAGNEVSSVIRRYWHGCDQRKTHKGGE